MLGLGVREKCTHCLSKAAAVHISLPSWGTQGPFPSIVWNSKFEYINYKFNLQKEETFEKQILQIFDS